MGCILHFNKHIFLFAQLSTTNYHLERDKTSISNTKELRLIRRRLLHLVFEAVVGLLWKMASLRRFSYPYANNGKGEPDERIYIING